MNQAPEGDRLAAIAAEREQALRRTDEDHDEPATYGIAAGEERQRP
jgi:hypothetical protein